MAIATPRLEITPLHPCLGTIIGGVDLTRPVDDEILRQIADAFDEYSVLVFHDQRFTDGLLAHTTRPEQVYRHAWKRWTS